MSRLQAVIFDLDGTLIDSMGIWLKVDIEYLSRRNLPVTPDLFAEMPEGNSFQELAHYVKNRFKLPESIEAICQEWTDMVRDHYENEIKLKAGAGELLQSLKESGIRLAIGTSNNFLLTEAVLQNNGVRDYFEVIITGDQNWRGKPYPDIFLAAAASMGIKPENCLVIEDTLAGVRSALAAGMEVIAIEDEAAKKDWHEMEKVAIFTAREIVEISVFLKRIMR